MKGRLKPPITYLITKGNISPELTARELGEILGIVSAAVEAGISMIQIREKSLSARALFEMVSRAALITKGTATKLLVNDRADAAWAAGADGVHLTAASARPEIIRKSFGVDFLIGVSTHSMEEVLAARRGRADFAVYGPVYESPGKGEAVGLEKLGQVCTQAEYFPVLALGGVDAENIADVFAAGAAGIAAIRYFNDRRNLSTKLEQIGKLAQM